MSELSQANQSLYFWFKSNPKANDRLLYPRWRVGVPTVLLKPAAAWFDVFVADARRNPGDGLLYFHDFLLNDHDLARSPDSILPKKIPAYALLFNYLYSFSAEKKGPLTVVSERILTLVMFGNPCLAVPVYEFRRQIDLKEFTRFASGLFRERGLTVTAFMRVREVYTAIEHWLWEAVLGFSFPPMADGWQERMLHLWAGYTPEAVRRLVTLHLSARRELRLYLTAAETLYLDTKSLVGCHSIPLVEECKVPKMSSVGMMQKFHDAEHTERLREQIVNEKAVYKWPVILTDVLLDCPEWYIPTMKAEVLLRGVEHSNCVGAYNDRHFQQPIAGYKVLLLFSDMYTAEILLRYRNNEIIKASVVQVRGQYNKDAPMADVRRVCQIATRMEKLPIDAFCPKIAYNDSLKEPSPYQDQINLR